MCTAPLTSVAVTAEHVASPAGGRVINESTSRRPETADGKVESGAVGKKEQTGVKVYF